MPPKHKIESEKMDYRNHTIGQSGLYKKMPIVVDKNVRRDIPINHTKTSVAYWKMGAGEDADNQKGYSDLRNLKGRPLRMYPYNSIDGETPLYFRTRDNWYKHPEVEQSPEDVDSLSKNLTDVQLILQGLPMWELQSSRYPVPYDPYYTAMYDAESRQVEQMRMLRDGLSWQENRLKLMIDTKNKGHIWTQDDDARMGGLPHYKDTFDAPGSM